MLEPLNNAAGWLDQVITTFSPARGLRRQRARVALEMLRGFDGARVDRATGGWSPPNGSADAVLAPSRTRLVDRARDLARNSPYAANGVTKLSHALVGTGITLRARHDDEAVARWADGVWRQFVGSCDDEGISDFAGIQTLAARAMVESGEALIYLRPRGRRQGEVANFRLRVMEADHLDARRNGRLENGGAIKEGIEYDRDHNRVAYWLTPHHPGDSHALPMGNQSQRVPAEDVLHLFERLRPGQTRGVPWLSATIQTLYHLHEYDEAERLRKHIEACLAVFVSGGEGGLAGSIGINAKTENDKVIETLEAGAIYSLAPGEQVNVATPSASGGYPDYVRLQLQAAAAGLGIPFHMLSGDLRQANYSSTRSGMLDFWRRMEALQQQIMVHGLCRPIWWRVVAYAAAVQKLDISGLEVEATPPRFDSLDPVKDANAEILAVRAGLMSLQEAIARQGRAPEEVLAEIAEMNAAMDKMGIVLDSDPRQSTRTGQARTSKQSKQGSKGPDVSPDD